jgi:hypothetical protein
MAIKQCVAVWLGVKYDSQPTNRELGGLLARTPTPSSAPLLVAWVSYMTPSWPEYTRCHQKQVYALLFDSKIA